MKLRKGVFMRSSRRRDKGIRVDCLKSFFQKLIGVAVPPAPTVPAASGMTATRWPRSAAPHVWLSKRRKECIAIGEKSAPTIGTFGNFIT